MTGKRIWRTTDGRLVRDGHPDAAFLEYGEGDDPPKSVLNKLDNPEGSEEEHEEEEEDEAPAKRAPAKKAAPRPADKSRKPAADK